MQLERIHPDTASIKGKTKELAIMLILTLSGFFIVCNVYTMVPIIDLLTKELNATASLVSMTTSSFTLF